jgi:hypothetical protein
MRMIVLAVDHSVAPRVHEQLLVMKHKFITRKLCKYHISKYTSVPSVQIKPSYSQMENGSASRGKVLSRDMEDDDGTALPHCGFMMTWVSP